MTVSHKITVSEVVEVYKPIAATLKTHSWKSWCRAFEKRWGTRPLASLTAGDINTFIAERRKAGLSEATLQSQINTLKRLYAAARSVGLRLRFPEETARIKVDNSKVVSLNEKDSARLKAHLLSEDWDICEVARETGIRGAELWSLKRFDVDLETGFITVRRTKNGKVRRTPITKRAAEALGRMLEANESDYLINPLGQRCKGRQNSMEAWKAEVFRPALRALGIKGFSFHGFRHDCATRLARAGHSLYAIQRWLGHSNPTHTARYSHLVDDDLRRIAEQGF